MTETETCDDCGWRPRHQDSHNYCRVCAEKGGDRNSFTTPIDHDKLRALVGDETAARIIAECRNDNLWFG